MGLLGDYLPDWLPADQDKADALRSGLLNFGAAMMASPSTNFGRSLGQGLLTGAKAYGDQEDQQQRLAMQKLQGKALNLNVQNQQLAYDKARRLETAYTDYFSKKPDAASPDPAPYMKNVSAPVDNSVFPRQQMPAWMPQASVPASGASSGAVTASSVPASASPVAAQTGDNYGRHLKFAQYLEQNGMPEEAQKYYDLAEKFRPKIKDQKTLMQNGKPVNVITYEDGRQEVSQFGAMPDVQIVSLGNKQVAIDKNVAQNGQSWAMGQSPDSVASNALGWANYGLSNKRFGFEQQQANKPQFHEGFWVTPPTATAPGGAATKVQGYNVEKPLTEAQGAALGFGYRAKEAQRIVNDLEKGGTLNGGRIMDGVSGIPFVGNALGASVNGLPTMLGGPNANQQSYRQGKENFITAVLRKESGAVISPDEFTREDKKYFVQPGEENNPAIIAQKRAAREMAVQALQMQAGRDLPEAKGAAKAPPATKPVQLDGGGSVVAKLGADGNYYVVKNGKKYRVEE